MNFWKKLHNAMVSVENAFMVIMLVIMTLAATAQVINRNILKLPIVYFEELARYCMVYLGLIAGAVGLREGTQVSMTLLTGKLRGKAADIMNVICTWILTAFAIIIFIATLTLLANQIRSGQLSASMRIPMYIPYFALTFGFGIMAISQSVLSVLRFRNLFVKKEEE